MAVIIICAHPDLSVSGIEEHCNKLQELHSLLRFKTPDTVGSILFEKCTQSGNARWVHHYFGMWFMPEG